MIEKMEREPLWMNECMLDIGILQTEITHFPPVAIKTLS